MKRRPPLWLAAAAVTSFWMAVYSLGRWTVLFIVAPIHQDLRYTYVAAQAGLRYGWSSIYDPVALRALSHGFPATEQVIGSFSYVNPPLLAWVFSPLTFFSEPVAYAIWTLISLAALCWAWYLAAPYSGLARVTLLLLAIGLWPVLLGLYLGQPDLMVLALISTAWWFCAREQPIGTGIALAAATFLKPQMIAMLPLALLVSGRYRHVAAWAAASTILGVAAVLTLGSGGLFDWWHALQSVRTDPAETAETLVRVFGMGPLTIFLWLVQAAGALLVAYRRRQAEIVFAAGILGTVAVVFHYHYWDYASLILGAWLVLRTSPSIAHRVWLATGVVPMQIMTYQASHADIALIAPQLAWDAVWLGILLAGTFAQTERMRLGIRTPEPQTG